MNILKKEIDKYYSKEYDNLVTYGTKMYGKHHKFYESPYALVNASYTYLVDNIDKLVDKECIPKFVSTFIYRNTTWSNGFTEMEKKQRRVNTTIYNQEIALENEVETPLYEEDNHELRIKAIYDYYDNLESVEDRTIWEIYFEQQKQTVKDFAEYIKMNRTVAHKYVRELRNNIVKHYEVLLEEERNKELIQFTKQ